MIDEFLKITTVVKDFILGSLSRLIKDQKLEISSRDFCFCLLLNFAVWSTIGSLLPYLPVFYRSIGLSAEQTGFVIALKSLIGGVSCIFWGAFADKFKQRKAVFILSILSWTVFALCMAVLPPDQMFNSGHITGLIEAPGTINAKCYNQNTSMARIGECSKNNAKGYTSLTNPSGEASVITNATPAIGAVIKPTGGATTQIFVLSLITVSIWSFFGSASAPLLDDIVFRIIPKDQNTYGRFRSIGSFGYGIAALIVGIFVKDYIMNKQDVILTPDYRPAFYFTIFSSLVCVLAVLFINLTEEDGSLLPVHPKIPLLKNKRLLSVLGTVFCLGICHNMVQNFLLWYVEDIDGSHVCMGIIVLTEHLSEIPFFFFGEYAIKIFGHTRLIACACVVYAFRFLSYSIVTKPWLIVPFEIGNGITLALMWASAASYVSLMTPVKHQATTLGLLGGLHFQLGHCLSAVLAGELITHVGFKACWWIYATFILAVGAMFVISDTLLPKIENYEELEGKNVPRNEEPATSSTINMEQYPAESPQQTQTGPESSPAAGVENVAFEEDK